TQRPTESDAALSERSKSLLLLGRKARVIRTLESVNRSFGRKPTRCLTVSAGFSETHPKPWRTCPAPPTAGCAPSRRTRPGQRHHAELPPRRDFTALPLEPLAQRFLAVAVWEVLSRKVLRTGGVDQHEAIEPVTVDRGRLHCGHAPE